MPTRQLEENVKDTLQVIEDTVLKLAYRITEKKDIPVDEMKSITVKRYIFSEKMDMPLSTWYSYQMNHRINREYDSVNYIKDAGKFEIDMKEFLEENELMEDYNERIESES